MSAYQLAKCAIIERPVYFLNQLMMSTHGRGLIILPVISLAYSRPVALIASNELMIVQAPLASTTSIHELGRMISESACALFRTSSHLPKPVREAQAGEEARSSPPKHVLCANEAANLKETFQSDVPR